jgi:DNA-binding CsgD family transcriptional regulator
MTRKLDTLLDGLADARDLTELDGAIRALRDRFDVDHIVYHSVRSGGMQWAALTYDPAWVDAYIERDFQTIDPVVLSCFGRAAPVDWKMLDWSSRAARALLAEGVAHGLGNQGLSLPVRGPGGQFAVFTVNGIASEATWARFTRSNMNDLLLAAHYVNDRAVTLTGQGPPSPAALSPREADALTLLASGSSRAQVAERLAISEHTLRVYIDAARHKLGAANTTHAVASALARGLISP